MPNVTKVSEWLNPNKHKSQWFITLDDGTEAVCFSEQATELEIGKALPPGWIINPPKEEGWKPMLQAPKKPGGGGAPAWRNTEEGARFEQEQMNRRTALMQATPAVVLPDDLPNVLTCADAFFEWLQNVSAPRRPDDNRHGRRAGVSQPVVGADTPTSPAPLAGTKAGELRPAASRPEPPAAGDQSTLLPLRRNEALTKFKSPQAVVRRYEELAEAELAGRTSVEKFQGMTLEQLATVLGAVK